jgi:hypothetical protein
LLFASVLLLGAGTLHAQPDVRDHRGGARDHRTPAPPPPAATGPTEAPPTPREEKFAARAGFVWIAGRWDWKGKWEWVAGHWERERAGKQWRPGHWDKTGASWTFTDGAWVEGGATPPAVMPPVPPPAPPPVNDHRPHQAPPPPRTESAAMKPGFVWVAGRWDWRDDKWAWVDGHYERERAHKKWREARWEQRDGAYALVDGDWVDENAPPPPNVPPPGEMQPPVRDHRDHREWKLDRPTVSNYWPAKGKVGARVRIHGTNFPADAIVVWGADVIKGAKVTADEIVFDVPATATSGTIAIRRDHGRDLIVGPFEVAASYDAAAEEKRLEDERRKAAEAAWAARQKDLAKDRAARQAAWDQRERDKEANREQRRADRVAAIRAKWQAAFLADADTQAELTLHAQRAADLARMKDMAEVSANGKLAVRVDMLTTRENDRHEQRMQALQTAFQSKGGAP